MGFTHFDPDQDLGSRGGNFSCPWYGVVPFLGYLFHDRFRIYGYGFEQFFDFSGFVGLIFCKNSFIYW